MKTTGKSIPGLLIATMMVSVAVAGEPVTVQNFVRAESDHMLLENMKTFGIESGRFNHVRTPWPWRLPPR